MSRGAPSFLVAPLVPLLLASLTGGGSGCRTTAPAQSAARVETRPAATDVPDPDRDGDGIADKKDSCPDEPEDRDGFEDDDGCPEPDNDHDRILDADDKCPDEPEVYNGLEDADGCPDKGIVRAGTGLGFGPLTFDDNSAAVDRDAAAALDQFAALLARKPTKIVTMVGHADPHERRPKKLAAARAEAVRRYLVTRSVPSSNLVTRSAGADNPLCARISCVRDNRRVDFEIPD